MNKTGVIFKHELLSTLKRMSFIIVTIALPLLMLLGYGIYQGVQHWYHPSAPEEKRIGYVDQTGSFNDYASQLGATFVYYPSEEEVKEALLAEDIKEYFVIPQNYLSTGLITRYTLEREMEPPARTMEQIRTFLLSNLLGNQTTPEVVERAKTPMVLTSVRLDQSGEIATEQSVFAQFFIPYIFAIIFVLSIMFTSGYLLQSVAEEKENRLIEVLLSSVSARQLFIGKVLALGTAGLGQVLIWFVSLKVFAEVARVNIPVLSELSISPGLLALGLLYYVLGYLLFAVLFAVVGSIGSTAREAQSWSGIFAIPAMIPLWIGSVIITYPEHVVSTVLTLFPITAPVTVMMRLPAQAIPTWQLALSLVILVGSVVFCMWAGAKVFRTGLLMYGKRPALKEIIRYIREA